MAPGGTDLMEASQLLCGSVKLLHSSMDPPASYYVLKHTGGDIVGNGLVHIPVWSMSVRSVNSVDIPNWSMPGRTKRHQDNTTRYELQYGS